MSTTEKGLKSAEKPDSAQNDLQRLPSDHDLKRSNNHTILSPQPSEDPKDPLVSSSLPRLIQIGNLLMYLLVELASIQKNWYPYCFVRDQFRGLRLATRRSSCIDASS